MVFSFFEKKGKKIEQMFIALELISAKLWVQVRFVWSIVNAKVKKEKINR